MISVILPARNERENILAIIPAIHTVLDHREHEIVLVDDDSTDGTIDAVRSLNLPFVRILSRQDRGLGSAVGYGIKHSVGDVVVVMDSDFNHQPKYIVPLIEKLRGCDCVSGSRFLKSGSIAGRFYSGLSRMFNRLVRMAMQGGLTDYTYGFFAVRREALSALEWDHIFWGHGDYCIRFLFYLEKSGKTIVEIPVVNGERYFGQPNRNYVINFLRYSGEVIRLATKNR